MFYEFNNDEVFDLCTALEIDNINYELEDDYTPSTCYVDGLVSVNNEVRKLFISKRSFNLFITKIGSICELLSVFNDMTEKWSLLKYEPGCKFDEHVDSEGDYTMLLFPSNKINNITGGELVVHTKNETISNCDQSCEIITYAPGTFKKVTLIIIKSFNIHKVNEVITGNRYVFKKSFYSRECKERKSLLPESSCLKMDRAIKNMNERMKEGKFI